MLFHKERKIITLALYR